jgi:hypothetical protein
VASPQYVVLAACSKIDAKRGDRFPYADSSRCIESAPEPRAPVLILLLMRTSDTALRLIVINSRAKLLIVASMPSTSETSDTE